MTKPQKPNNKSTVRRSLSWRKKVLFATLVTAGFFLFLEIALALFGVRTLTSTDDPFVGFSGSVPLFVADGDDPDWMTTAENKLPWFNRQRFLRSKPDGTFRIFCLGGSTTYGRPYDDATSFSAWLRELLPKAAPANRWEVINAGGVSYASYRIAELMKELTTYEPDLFIIYTGHNEFLEERTYHEIRAESAAWRQVRVALCQSRTYSLMHRLVKPSESKKDARHLLPAEVNEILNHTVGPTSYHRDDNLRRQILDHFAQNLTRMVDLARASGAQVAFVTPACNLKDCSPFKSQHADGLSMKKRLEWNSLYEKGNSLAQQSKYKDALAAYKAAALFDDRFAELHYRTGKVLLQKDRLAEAAVAFRLAREEDVCPLRALAEINDIVRETASRLAVPLIDFESQLNNDCLRKHGHNMPGAEYFLDHVHLKIDVNRMLAASIIEKLAADGVIAGGATLDQLDIDAVTAKIMSRIDPAAHGVALRNLAKVLNWAGKHYEAGRLALEALKKIPDDPESLFLAAAYLQRTGKLNQAVAHYRRALARYPDAAEAHHRLGAALVEQDKLREALPHFKEVIRLQPGDADAHYNLGRLLLELGKKSDGIKHLRQALQISPNHAKAKESMNSAIKKSG